MSRRAGCTCDGSDTLCSRCAHILYRAERSISQGIARMAAGLEPVQAGQQRTLDTLEDEALARQEQEPETAFMARVIALAKAQGWEHYHTHRSDKSPAGFPDLVLCNGHQTLFVECKTNTGKLTMAQQRWLSLLAMAGQEVAVWRPKMWEEIVARLIKKAGLP